MARIKLKKVYCSKCGALMNLVEYFSCKKHGKWWKCAVCGEDKKL
jgi:predicted RNA-binding Zn-ribbon protein involved in translation (DUF1610 family)